MSTFTQLTLILAAFGFAMLGFGPALCMGANQPPTRRACLC